MVVLQYKTWCNYFNPWILDRCHRYGDSVFVPIQNCWYSFWFLFEDWVWFFHYFLWVVWRVDERGVFLTWYVVRNVTFFSFFFDWNIFPRFDFDWVVVVIPQNALIIWQNRFDLTSFIWSFLLIVFCFLHWVDFFWVLQWTFWRRLWHWDCQIWTIWTWHESYSQRDLLSFWFVPYVIGIVFFVLWLWVCYLGLCIFGMRVIDSRVTWNWCRIAWDGRICWWVPAQHLIRWSWSAAYLVSIV